MKDKKSILWIMIGVCLFVMPMLCYPFIRENLDETNYENRYLAEKPMLSKSNYREYSMQYETYFNDHLPYRNLLVRNMNLLKYFVFQENVGQVINGKEGWLFYSGANAINCYKRNSYFDEAYMQKLTDNLIKIDNSMKEQGIQFVVLLLPNKEEIYDEYMPDYYIKPDQPNRTDVLVDYIVQHSDIKIVYPKEELRSEKDNYQLYFKYDTHYNCLGAFVAYEQILDTLEKKRTYLSECNIEKETMSGRTGGVGDLEKMMGFSGVLNYDYEYYISDYPLIEDWTKQKYTNSDGKYKNKVILAGDSYRFSLLPYFSKDFQFVEVEDAGSLTDFSEAIKKSEPDIFVLELLERNDENMLGYDFTNPDH